MSLDAIAIEAFDHADYAEEFARLGVRVVLTRDEMHQGSLLPHDGPFILIPSRNAIAVRELVIAAKPKGGRPKGSFVEEGTFLKVWEMALDGKSIREISEATDGSSELEFVNRDKVTVIVEAVIADKTAARRALSGRKTPNGFSATDDGIKLPVPKPA